ncbi:MAG: tetratricopeptide repeat protein [Hydrogenophaga sp.]|jgi:hypothetical protein|uniref:hypothetical protein n=1 Tax=Hydrogenophaga sp. TaxID=1904254 RepID=UPI00262054FE|nr:hypothetical protein [Hydrogenophaga sp.]MCV0439558.1 tetratricopeptide repeat protein [Hydrogenophaga sp.]
MSQHSPSGLLQRTRRWLGVLAIVAGLALLALFGARAWHQYQYAQRVAAGQIKVETLRGWMTLPYIAKVYGVPESRLRETLGLPPTGDEDRSLRSWLDLQGIDPVSGRARIEALILAETTRREAPGD